MSYIFSTTSKRIVRSEIRELLKLSRKEGIISFGGGLPDASLFPIQDLIEISKEVLEHKGYMALQYGPTPGEPEMLDAILEHMNSLGDPVKTEQICVSSSSQQGLDLVTHLFIDENSPIIVEIPSYLGSLQAFSRAGAEMHGIVMDEHGMVLEDLEAKLKELEKQNKKPRFIYTIPEFQNPSGITMSLERRKKLISIAHSREIPIIEDSPYRELTYSGKPIPSIWSLAKGQGVILLKTLSKTLFPGMRLGWICAEHEIIEKIIMLKQSVDLCSPSFNQFLVAMYLKRGKMKETIKKAIKCYEPKKDAMLKALSKYMPEGVHWSQPEGGMFLWLMLPEKYDTMDMFPSAIEEKVVYIIGRPFHYDHSGGNTMRLSYSFPSVEQIDEGIKRLGNCIKKTMSLK